MTFRASSGGWGRSPGRMGSSGRVAVTDAQISAIFAATPGAKVWYDLSDVTTLQQDSAGTVPVTAPGQEIGRVQDKSGAANHATQATIGSLPVWQTSYAALDGLNDSWATSAIDFTTTDKITLVVGVRKASDVLDGTIVVLGVSGSNGSIEIRAPGSVGVTKFQVASKGTTSVVPFTTNTIYNAPISAVVTAVGDIGAPNALLRINSTQVSSISTTQGSGTYGNAPLYVGRTSVNAVPFNGNLYGLMVFSRLLSPAELLLCERYMAQKTGTTF